VEVTWQAPCNQALQRLAKNRSRNDVAGNVYLAQPRPRVYMWLRLFAACPLPASAARRYQPTAAG